MKPRMTDYVSSGWILCCELWLCLGKITVIEFEDIDAHSQVRTWLMGVSSRSDLIN